MGLKKYKLLKKKGEGTFSEVLAAQNLRTEEFHAIKCMKATFSSWEQVNGLREIQALRRLSPHPNIVRLDEVLYDKGTGRLALVFELMSLNLYELIRGRKRYLSRELVKIYAWQLMRGLAHMHSKGVFHRDIKPENVLVAEEYDVYTGLKLADFGSCRGAHSKRPFTEYISTRWYRAPECLLTDGWYGPEMDIWGAACVLFEVSTLKPLFPGKDEKDQVVKIHNVLGTPPPAALSIFDGKRSVHMSFEWQQNEGKGILKSAPPGTLEREPLLLDLLTKMLAYNPADRITSQAALQHAYFDDLRSVPIPPEVQEMLAKSENNPSLGSSAGAASGTTTSRTARASSVPAGGTTSHKKAGSGSSDYNASGVGGLTTEGKEADGDVSGAASVPAVALSPTARSGAMQQQQQYHHSSMLSFSTLPPSTSATSAAAVAAPMSGTSAAVHAGTVTGASGPKTQHNAPVLGNRQVPKEGQAGIGSITGTCVSPSNSNNSNAVNAKTGQPHQQQPSTAKQQAQTTTRGKGPRLVGISQQPPQQNQLNHQRVLSTGTVEAASSTAAAKSSSKLAADFKTRDHNSNSKSESKTWEGKASDDDAQTYNHNHGRDGGEVMDDDEHHPPASLNGGPSTTLSDTATSSIGNPTVVVPSAPSSPQSHAGAVGGVTPVTPMASSPQHHQHSHGLQKGYAGYTTGQAAVAAARQTVAAAAAGAVHSPTGLTVAGHSTGPGPLVHPAGGNGSTARLAMGKTGTHMPLPPLLEGGGGGGVGSLSPSIVSNAMGHGSLLQAGQHSMSSPSASALPSHAVTIGGHTHATASSDNLEGAVGMAMMMSPGAVVARVVATGSLSPLRQQQQQQQLPARFAAGTAAGAVDQSASYSALSKASTGSTVPSHQAQQAVQIATTTTSKNGNTARQTVQHHQQNQGCYYTSNQVQHAYNIKSGFSTSGTSNNGINSSAGVGASGVGGMKPSVGFNGSTVGAALAAARNQVAANDSQMAATMQHQHHGPMSVFERLYTSARKSTAGTGFNPCLPGAGGVGGGGGGGTSANGAMMLMAGGGIAGSGMAVSPSAIHMMNGSTVAQQQLQQPNRYGYVQPGSSYGPASAYKQPSATGSMSQGYMIGAGNSNTGALSSTMMTTTTTSRIPTGRINTGRITTGMVLSSGYGGGTNGSNAGRMNASWGSSSGGGGTIQKAIGAGRLAGAGYRT